MLDPITDRLAISPPIMFCMHVTVVANQGTDKDNPISSYTMVGSDHIEKNSFQDGHVAKHASSLTTSVPKV